MIGRMKINTFTFRVSLDRAPYRKSACVFESRFLLRPFRAPDPADVQDALARVVDFAGRLLRYALHVPRPRAPRGVMEGGKSDAERVLHTGFQRQ